MTSGLETEKAYSGFSTPHHNHNHFTAPFPGPPGWAGAKRELLDLMAQGKINRGRHTDHPAGRHSMRTNQCPPPPFPIFFTGRIPFLSLKQQCQSTEGSSSPKDRLQSHQVHLTMLQYYTVHMHAMYAKQYTHKNESTYSEMGPVRQNPTQRTVRSVHMCVHYTVHNCCT